METEILSDEEPTELTGYKTRGYQRRWLNDRGWLFVESRGGRPLVGRRYVRMKLGAPFEVASVTLPPPAAPTCTPDISKVR